MKSIKTTLILSALICFWINISIVVADELNINLGNQEQTPIPILTYMESHGVKLTYLGNEGGLKGYLGESVNGHFQTFYVSPDGKHVISGIMNNSQGVNITGVQIGEMQKRFQQAEEMLLSGDGLTDLQGSLHNENETRLSGVETLGYQQDIIKNSKGSTLELPNFGVLSESEISDNHSRNLNEISTMSSNSIVKPNVAIKTENFELNTQNESKKYAFLSAVANTTYFEIGNPNAKTLIWKLADPKCGYCHRAWEQLKAYVENGLVKVRIIPVGLLEGSQELLQTTLLSKNPAQTWLDLQDGKRVELRQYVSENQFQKVNAKIANNHKFVKEMGIKGTPYLAFVDSNGIFHSSRGLPNNMENFLMMSFAELE